MIQQNYGPLQASNKSNEQMPYNGKTQFNPENLAHNMPQPPRFDQSWEKVLALNHQSLKKEFFTTNLADFSWTPNQLPPHHEQVPHSNHPHLSYPTNQPIQSSTSDSCIGLMTPSPSGSSDSSGKSPASHTGLDSYHSGMSKAFASLPQYHYTQSANQFWNPYMHHPFSQPVDLHLNNHMGVRPVDTYYPSFSIDYPANVQQPQTLTPSSHSQSEHQAELPHESSQSEQALNQARRSRRCKCPNCVPPLGSAANTLPVSKEQKKKHLCHFEGCGKNYGKTSHLKAHLRWHDGVRPFLCTFDPCGKSFTRSDELSRHLRTHTGDKRFRCIHCDKGFTRSDHLAKHVKIHFKDPSVDGVKMTKRGRKSSLPKPPNTTPNGFGDALSDLVTEIFTDPAEAKTPKKEDKEIEQDFPKENLPVGTKSYAPFLCNPIFSQNSFYFPQSNFSNPAMFHMNRQLNP